MYSKLDVRNYFKKKDELNQTEDRGSSVEIVCSASGSANNAELKLVEEETKQAVRSKKHQMVPYIFEKKFEFARPFIVRSRRSLISEGNMVVNMNYIAQVLILGKIFTKKNQMLDIKTLVGQILLMTISWPKYKMSSWEHVQLGQL